MKTKQKYPLFESACEAHGLPTPQREVRFHPTRRWRFDFAWVHVRLVGASGIRSHDPGVALEVEGGAYSGHGHRSVGKFIRDMEKYNEAELLGWVLLRCTPQEIKSGAVFTLLKRAMG